MNRERQTILSLIALGRITPREGERLIAVWNAGREELWVIAACVVAGLAQGLPVLERLIHIVLPSHHWLVAIMGRI